MSMLTVAQIVHSEYQRQAPKIQSMSVSMLGGCKLCRQMDCSKWMRDVISSADSGSRPTFMGSCQLLPERLQGCQLLLALHLLCLALLFHRVPLGADLADFCIMHLPCLLLQYLGGAMLHDLYLDLVQEGPLLQYQVRPVLWML